MPRAKMTITYTFEYELPPAEYYPEGATLEEMLAVDAENFVADDPYRTAEILEGLAEGLEVSCSGELIPDDEAYGGG